MRSNETNQKRRLSHEELERKRNAISEIRHFMIKCYPDARSQKAKEQILAHVSALFINEFGSQKDEIRNKIISRLFNQGQTETLTLTVNGVTAELEIMRYAKLRKVNGVPTDRLSQHDLPKYFREGIMAELFKKEVNRRLNSDYVKRRPVIDVTPTASKRGQNMKITSFFKARWFRRFQYSSSTSSI